MSKGQTKKTREAAGNRRKLTRAEKKQIAAVIRQAKGDGKAHTAQQTMWKNDRFFEERKVAFTPKIAAALLKSGKVNVKKLYSPKTGKTYDGTIVLADTGGKYVNYRVELPKKK